MVAVPAIVSLNIPTKQEKVVVVWGEEVEVVCLVERPGNPAPIISLSLNKSSDMAQLGGGSRAKVSYYPTMEETGSVFICKWEQVGPGGEVLYQGEEVSAPLEVIMAPSILAETPAEYLYEDRMELVVQFMAKPAPGKEDVQWFLVMDNQTKLGVEKIGDMGEFVVGEIKANKMHEFVSSIFISNLTENIMLGISIRNMAGSVEKIFSIMVPSPTTPYMALFPTMKQLHITTPSTTIMDMTAGSMAGLIALFLFTIFLILITIILVRYRRTGQEHKDRDSGQSGR